MAALTITTTAAAGTVLPALAAAAAGGDTFVNTGRESVEVANGGGAPITITFVTTGTYNIGAVSYAIADNAQTVTNGTSKVFGPFDTSLYGNPCSITYSAVTSVTVRVVSLGLA